MHKETSDFPDVRVPGPSFFGKGRFTTSVTNNQSPSFSYDAAGNVISGPGPNGSHSYTYDAEGRMLTVDGGSTASYMYGSGGQRVRSTFGGDYRDFLYDQSGHVITTLYSGGWGPGEVFAGGLHIATYTNSTTYFMHTDWLGTIRNQTDVSGDSAQAAYSLPFGDAFNAPGPSLSRFYFAGQYWDGETYLDYTPFRQYNPTSGRWMTPDPAGLAAVDPTNPQTWNRYAYVANNPINAVDPSGLMMCVDCTDTGGAGRGFQSDTPIYMMDGVPMPSFALHAVPGYNRQGLCLGGVCITGHLSGFGTWGNLFNSIFGGDWSGFFPAIPGYNSPLIFDATPGQVNPNAVAASDCRERAGRDFAAATLDHEAGSGIEHILESVTAEGIGRGLVELTNLTIFGLLGPIHSASEVIQGGYELSRYLGNWRDANRQYVRAINMCEYYFGN